MCDAMLRIEWDSEALRRLPELTFWVATIEQVRVTPSDASFSALEAEVVAQVRQRIVLDQLKDHPVARRYRDFYWRDLGIDPTKVRPAGEALVRRVLQGNQLYRINNVVDAYNLASLRTLLAFGVFDLNVLAPPLTVRFAQVGEPFLGIAMRAPISLTGRELLVADAKAIVSVHPYRDADRSKVTGHTTRLLILTGGVPNLDDATVEAGLRVAIDYITRVAGGRASTPSAIRAPAQTATGQG
jgi:DNA/RNA-binding domain of Phe-tRNA-synthetase-like protein